MENEERTEKFIAFCFPDQPPRNAELLTKVIHSKSSLVLVRQTKNSKNVEFISKNQ
jgi:hypothetical protein